MTTPQEVPAPAYPFHGNVRPILNEVLHALDKLLGDQRSNDYRPRQPAVRAW